MTDDLSLIRGEFFNTKFPPDFSYYHYYFKTELPICFAKYYLEFKHLLDRMSIVDYWQQFVDHTGLSCSDSRFRYLLNRIQTLQTAEKKATDEFDVETLMLIKDGKFKLDR